jgi:hypothetical protein
MNEVTHIAAQPIVVSGRRQRQRCAWCGAVLIDYDLARVAVKVEPGQVPQPPSTWEVGVLVRVVGGYSSVVDPEFVNGEPQLPENSCASVDDEVTR